MKAFNEKKKSKNKINKENETPHLDGWLDIKKKKMKTK